MLLIPIPSHPLIIIIIPINPSLYVGLTESASFINALSTQAAKWHEKRVRKIKTANIKSHQKVGIK